MFKRLINKSLHKTQQVYQTVTEVSLKRKKDRIQTIKTMDLICLFNLPAIL